MFMSQFESRRQAWEHQAADLSDPGAQVGRAVHSEEFQLLISRLQSLLDLRPQQQLLDIGCGNGFLIEQFQVPLHLSGIDYSENMIQAARQRLKGDFQVGSALHLPWPDQSFDRVLCYSMFHYLTDVDEVKKVVAECLRVCRPGGVVLLGDLLDQRMEAEIKQNSDPVYEQQIAVIHRYSEWLFVNLEDLCTWLQPQCQELSLLEQPEGFRLASYRKDIRLKK